MNNGPAEWTIPIQLSVTLGTPQLVSAGTAVAPARTAEGLAARRAPIVALESTAPFSRESLTATSFNWNTALSLALASQLAYADAPAVNTTARNAWGLTTCAFVEADDTQCFVASSTAAVLVAFRGTESLRDWLADLNVLSTGQSYGIVHRGFFQAFQAVKAQLQASISALSGKPLVITGHSLGGALATIAAAEWKGKFPISAVYTYGQPCVGKGGFPSFMSQHYVGKFFRFVNDDDIVPRVPPNYRHVGRLFHFDADGNLPSNVEMPGLEAASAGPPVMTEAEFDQLRSRLLAERSAARSAGVAESLLPGPELEGIVPSVSDHRLDEYIWKIAHYAG